MTEDTAGKELVSVARVIKPKGLKGEVVAELFTDFPERFENLERVLIPGSPPELLEIEKFRFEKNRIVFKFRSIDSIERAERLRGAELCVEEADAVELEEGEYFDWELEGCTIESINGETVGIVKEVFRAGENVNLVVSGAEKEYMVPFVEAICTEVDIDSKKILVDLPEGLLEF